MRVTESINLRFKAGNGLFGQCGADFIERPDGLIVMLVTEPAHAEQPSITNCAEVIARALYAEGWRWDFYVEHYTDRLNWATNRNDQETFDLCFFEHWLDMNAPFSNPQWLHLEPVEYQSLIEGRWQTVRQEMPEQESDE